jgi:uncharacterized LabA/DUF88 family protein
MAPSTATKRSPRRTMRRVESFSSPASNVGPACSTFAFASAQRNRSRLLHRIFSAGLLGMSSGKSALFIDGQSLHHAARALNFDVDFHLLLEEFDRRGSIVRAYYYTTVSEHESEAIRPLIDWLAYNRFTVRTKPVREYDDRDGRRRMKRDIGIELAVDAMEMAKHIENIFLFSGDGDFRYLVERLQRQGVFTTVISSIRTKPMPMLADDLRRQADAFVELDDLRDVIARR